MKQNTEDVNTLKEELLDEIAGVIKEEVTENVDLLEESKASTWEIIKMSLGQKNKTDLLIKTLMLIAILFYESFAIIYDLSFIYIVDVLFFLATFSYFIYRFKHNDKSVRIILELPLIIPLFLLYPFLDAGIDFIRWVMIICIIIDYLIDYILDLILHKQIILISIIWLFILYVGTIGYIRFEDLSFADSFWLVWVTSTTVGYGDFFAVTIYGRLVTIFLMLGGIAIVSALTAFILDYIQKHTNDRAKEILDEIEATEK